MEVLKVRQAREQVRETMAHNVFLAPEGCMRNHFDVKDSLDQRA